MDVPFPDKKHPCKFVSVGTLKEVSSDQFALVISVEKKGWMKSYSRYMGMLHKITKDGGLDKAKLLEHMVIVHLHYFGIRRKQ